MTWLDIIDYKTDYNGDSEATLKEIDNRRQMMTSDYLKSRLDAIRERLTSPKTALRTLPEGDKGTDVFNTIMEKYRGKYVYVDFWGIYCGPCRSSIEASRQLRDSLAARQDIELVFITSDKQSPQKQYDEYVEKNLKGEESCRISDDDNLRLMSLFGFNAIPHYELVAPDGRIIEIEDVREMFSLSETKFLEEHRKIVERSMADNPDLPHHLRLNK